MVSWFCFSETLKVTRAKCFVVPPYSNMEKLRNNDAVLAAVETEMSYKNDTIMVFFSSQLTKNKDKTKVALASSNSTILSLI